METQQQESEARKLMLARRQAGAMMGMCDSDCSICMAGVEMQYRGPTAPRGNPRGWHTWHREAEQAKLEAFQSGARHELD